MTDVVVYAALAVAAVVCLLSVVGVLVARDAFDGMHFTGPASSVAPVAVAFAIVADQGPTTQAGIKPWPPVVSSSSRQRLKRLGGAYAVAPTPASRLRRLHSGQ